MGRSCRAPKLLNRASSATLADTIVQYARDMTAEDSAA